MEMVYTRKIERAGANPESPPITQTETNIREVHTSSWTVFIREHSELFIKKFVQYSQEAEVDELHYLGLGLNESSTEDDTKKVYRSLAC